MAKRCKTCQYRAGKFDPYKCDYILIVGHSRGCSAKNCDKYVEGKKIRLKDAVVNRSDTYAES